MKVSQETGSEANIGFGRALMPSYLEMCPQKAAFSSFRTQPETHCSRLSIGNIMEFTQADRQHLDKSKQDTGSLGNTDDALKYDSGRVAHDFSCIHSKDLLPAEEGEEATKHFLQELVNILLDYISKSLKRGSKVIDFHYPHQFKEGLEGFSLELPDQPDNLEQLLVDCRDTLKYGVKTGNPRFFNQLSTGLDIIGLAGEWLTSTANTNMVTYEISPVFILMEEVVLRKMHSIIGWQEEDGDGIFCPGGTMSNLYSVLLARFHLFPAVKTHGMSAIPRLALFTSAHSHYSIKKSAAVLGIGSENVIVVRCDERAHSVTWNPHKMMGVPLQCSAILVKRKGLLQECNQLCAEYLFQPDKHYDVTYDIGDKAIQCGRHVDIFKLWLMWKAKGSEGFEAQVNHCLENAEYLYYKLKRRADFQLVFKGKPEHSNVCFWYLPKRVQNIPPGPERDRELHMVAPKIKTKMMEEGFTMIGYQPLKNKVNFFRCVFSNPATQREDVDFLLVEIARLGCEL
ncbi:Glutamate decarboxylase 1 [Anabarilius grahami]|uniref:Glutamate decarboxylase 1 n=1 Tax=Anabarilius grahami TaxID=495550 RepID=A0A3N0YED4_ANAGA|nr:Glutamate decarboxylase 1 [Anabarilius grahami]